MYKKPCSQLMIFISFPIKKNYNPLLLLCPLCPTSPPAPPTKSNLYLANSLAAAISDPALYRLLIFQVPSNMFLFRLRLRDTFSRNTPPGDPSGGVVYLRIVLFPEKASQLVDNS